MYLLWKLSCNEGVGWGYEFENGKVETEVAFISIMDSYDNTVPWWGGGVGSEKKNPVPTATAAAPETNTTTMRPKTGDAATSVHLHWQCNRNL